MAGPFSVRCILHVMGRSVRKLFPTVLILLSVVFIAGCSPVASTPKHQTSASPTKSNSTASPTEAQRINLESINSMRRGLPNLVKNDLETEFLNIAINSCNKALEDGFVIKNSEGTSYFISSSDSLFDRFKIKEVSLKDGVVGGPKYLDWAPGLFYPCETLIQADVVNPSDDNYVILEHSLKKTNDGEYKWGQHHGSASLDETTYTVGSDGLISGYLDGTWKSEVRYGPLTETELGYFK